MLTVILGHAELALLQAEPDKPPLADLKEIHKAASRSADLTRQLLAYARKQTVAPQALDLNKTVADALNMLQRLIGEGISLVWMPGADLARIKMDPSQVDQILANLCVNARDAIEDVGKITIETKNRTIDEGYCSDHPGFVPGEYVQLVVSDNGRGMNKETLANIFEPFFTTKELGKGTGLGLATVYGIVKQNNGFINVYSEPGQGATFTIYLPQYSGEAGQAQTEDTETSAPHGQETILLVEDEAAVLSLTTILLKKLGYTVLAAGTPDEAIRLARKYDGRIHLLITDMVMPGMNGRDLAEKLRPLHSNLKRLFMSGYTADVITKHGVLDKSVRFIQKPFSRQNLAAKVREALENK
jgi:CheY-like chemotaxis protein